MISITSRSHKHRDEKALRTDDALKADHAPYGISTHSDIDKKLDRWDLILLCRHLHAHVASARLQSEKHCSERIMTFSALNPAVQELNRVLHRRHPPWLMATMTMIAKMTMLRRRLRPWHGRRTGSSAR